jgi:hypothetical protein
MKETLKGGHARETDYMVILLARSALGARLHRLCWVNWACYFKLSPL